MLRIVLYTVAFVCFAASVWQYATPYWNRFVSLGLCALTLALFLAKAL